MKILIVIDEFYGSNGISRVNENLAKEWIQKGHKVIFLTFRSNFKEFRTIIMDSFFYPSKKNKEFVKGIIDSEKPEIILCNAGRIGLCLPKKSYICRFGGCFPWDFYYSFKVGIKEILFSAYIHLAQFRNIQNSKLNIAPTKYFAKLNSKIFGKNFKYIFNGINHKKFSPIGKKINLSKNSILFVGEIYPRKGINLLLKTFKLIQKENPKTKLHIIGKDKDKILTDKIKKDFGIIYHGTKGNVEEYIRGCSVFLFPSYVESFGNVLLEAQACGKPIVAQKVNIFPEMIQDNKTGLLAKKNNAKDLANKVILLLKNPKLAKQMGKNGVKFAKKYSWEKVAKQYLKVFKQVIRENKTNNPITNKFIRPV